MPSMMLKHPRAVCRGIAHMDSVPRSSGIYKIINLVNKKIYIGSSNNLERRWGEHKNALRNNKHDNSHLQAAWNKYGELSFSFEVLELVMPWSILDREQYWLDELKPFGKQGYNGNRIADKPPSQSGKKASPETLVKLSVMRKGKPHSPEWCAKIGISNKG